MTIGLVRGIACAALVCATAPALAQQAERVATHTDWSVFEASDSSKQCWSVSGPKKTVNTRGGKIAAVRRGDILLFVSYFPGASVSGQVSFTGGYPFREGSTAEVKIRGRTFELFTEGERAWAATDADDASIVAAMKNGAEAVITAFSTRGTKTEDTFSLLGFTAAVEEAKKRCSN